MRIGLLLREGAGWLLLVVGLAVFGLALLLLLERRIFEAVPATAIGFIVFRGGIHLLKSALALQAVREWQSRSGAATGSRTASMISPKLLATLPQSSSTILPGSDSPSSRSLSALP